MRFQNETLLSNGNGALSDGEGAFLLCTFWLADNLALQGRYDEPRDIFEQLLRLRNDVEPLSEQYDPEAGRMVGNFPQAFSHVGLINTARNLARRGGPARTDQTQRVDAPSEGDRPIETSSALIETEEHFNLQGAFQAEAVPSVYSDRPVPVIDCRCAPYVRAWHRCSWPVACATLLRSGLA